MGPIIDLVNDIVRSLTINSAAHRLSSPEDLLHDPAELPGHGPGPHHAGGLVDVVDGDVAAVLDVLHLLPVPGGLLESFDDEGGGGRHHRHLGLSVLDTELDGNL